MRHAKQYCPRCYYHSDRGLVVLLPVPNRAASKCPNCGNEYGWGELLGKGIF